MNIKNPLEYIPAYFKVQSKADEHGESRLVPMTLWPVQQYYIEHRTNRDVILKSRQPGMSTGILAANSHVFFTYRNERQTIITHDDETSTFLLATVRRFHTNLPSPKPKKGYDAGHRISLEVLDNYMYIDSAKSDSIGIGHGLTRAHLSEVAKWPPRRAEQLFADISQTIPAGGFNTVECYSEDTEILTKRGWVKFPDLQNTDEVLTKGADNRAYFTKPEKMHAYPYKGQMLSIKTEHLDLCVTPNHQLWIRSNWGKWKFQEAQTLPKCRISFDSSMKWDGVHNDYFVLPSYEATHHNKKDLPEVKIPSAIWASFLGYFLSEGWVSPNRVSIGQDKDAPNIHLMRELCEVLANILGKELRVNQNKNCVTYMIGDTRLSSYLANYTKPKRLPPYVQDWSCDLLTLLLEAFKRGDGDQARNRLYNVSKELMDELQIVCLKLGYNTNLSYHKDRDDRWEREYLLSYWNKYYIDYRQSRHLMQRVDYDGMVYCVTVSTHLVLVRRNGKAIWCGNSTPKGRGGLFYTLYTDAKRGINGYKPFFFPWWWDITAVGDPVQFLTDEKAEAAALMLNISVEKFLKDENAVVDRNKLSPEQIAFRRSKICELKYLFFQEYPETDNDCWLSSEMTVFDAGIIRQYLQNIMPGRTEGHVTTWKDVIGGQKYIIGADPAGGYEKGDYSVAVVLRARNNEYVCRLRGRIPPDMFSEELMRLGYRYNQATIAVERIMHGHTVLKILMDNHYPNIYYYEDYDKSIGSTETQPGWKTSLKTKPQMIDTLSTALRSNDIIIYSENFLQEALGFIWEGQKTRTSPGGYDDELDAVMIALQVREQSPIIDGKRYEPVSYVGRVL